MTRGPSLPTAKETYTWSITATARFRRFVQTGDPDNRFHHNVQASGLLVSPSDVAVTTRGDGVRVLITDAAASRIFLFDGSGLPEHDANGRLLSIPLDPSVKPMGLAATASSLFIGDNGRGRILQVQLTPADRFGSATDIRGYRGPVSGLSMPRTTRFWLTPVAESRRWTSPSAEVAERWAQRGATRSTSGIP